MSYTNYRMKQKILVADDDQDILDAMRVMLEIANYDVDIIGEGKKIIEKIKKIHPDLLLLDLWMSGISGVDVCNQIRKNKEIKNIPIILVSASSELKANASRATFNDVIAKPFDMDELLIKIKNNTTHQEIPTV